ncbi:MAG: tyrosine-type recombinase/integrase [Candidatus Woesearchaeota archaeon]
MDNRVQNMANYYNNTDWELKIVDECKLRGYSRKTINAYVYHIKRFLDSGKDLKTFLLDMINQGRSPSSVRVAGFAVKFYLSINRICDTTTVPNMKKPKSIPNILSKQEVLSIISSTINLKHRLIIEMLYSTGMRLSELINVKWHDIDFKRNLINIKNGKGGKDRIVMLSKKLKKSLFSFTRDREGYVFISQKGGKYSPATIQKIVQGAAKKAGIKKKVTPHTLRHSFATHLLDKGTDIRYIKDLLGHSDISTTLIYTKVSNKNILNIKSPLDD